MALLDMGCEYAFYTSDITTLPLAFHAAPMAFPLAFHWPSIGLGRPSIRYSFYASDITCSFPVSGVYTADQRLVYEAVLDAQKHILAVMRPGVPWSDMHRLMWRVTLTHLKQVRLLPIAPDCSRLLPIAPDYSRLLPIAPDYSRLLPIAASCGA